jgi:Na+-translocating ferredoxin:NAD+ oxidoreductase RnfD subunit
VQSGNEVWPVLLIWVLGSLILYRFGLLHIPLVFLAAFIPLSFLRSAVTGNPWQAELGPMTSPMFQLYIFFMITDPKTITRTRRRQCLVAVLIAIMETILRLGLRDIYSLFHALFIVGPIANLIEIWWSARQKAVAAIDGPSSAPCPQTAG